ncbi:DNA-packaging protein [Mucilaginibacter sp. UR6-11]|uniref:DNA-packaging protein n=1 Tax=Mucilaginibacter sp. UR6-11 TaxID=1435644 RepID=UPI001E334DAD|nr:DNA-packaging protein [Mucilaginibacter sp. UR6-11]MCC8427230.1 DNA-packaging protein [Mucilaginibacter sp. UR6-11]
MKKTKYFFTDRESLLALIELYFERTADNPASKAKKNEPPTIAGLALFLGFNSKDDFDQYESKGKLAPLIKRARFRVIAYYENRLHYPAPTGAMFALKSMGWNEKSKTKKADKKISSIKVKLIESGPQPAANEKDVAL